MLELKIESLTAAINTLIDAINKQGTHAPVAPMVAPVAFTQAAPTVAALAPTIVQAVVAPSAPVVSGTPVAMPAPPTFMAPAPVAAVAGAPFTDGKGLIDYVMSAYKALGPQKGAQIQGVLTGLGYQNINDVKPEHYGQLFAGVEALK
jgi:hypothetical protein